MKKTKEMLDFLTKMSVENYKDMIKGILAFENNIEITDENMEVLGSIVEKWFDSDYSLINECFNDTEYDLFNDEEKDLLGGQ